MLKDSYGKWTFPKGHVQKDESYQQGAEREILEEMGVKNLKLVKKLGTIDIWFRDRFVFKGRLIHKFIHYYLFEVKDNIRLEKPKPKKGGEKIQAVAWVPADQVIKRSNYKDMKPIIRRAFETLRIDL
jgi:ADP-ribose pyrophosphatase YjhB (NUDIX family)